jgi:hypothetical protein
LGESLGRRIGLVAAFLVGILLAFACSGDEDGSTGTGSTDFPARTLAATPETTAATSASPPPGTTGSVFGVVLRLEGDAGTSFTGVCTTGAENSVLVGQVPKSYSFDLQGQILSCQIKKQSPGNGSLRTILLTGDNTRSIQQTESQESTINISYSGG